MNKKQVFVVLIVFFFVAVSAYAKPKQKQPPPQPVTIDDILAKMKYQLQLTDDQVIKVKPIIEDYLAQEQQLKLEEKKQLRKVLTDQQLFTWNFLQNEAPSKDKKKH